MRTAAAKLPSVSAPQRAGAPAVFIDKDGTLAYDVPYNTDPARLRLREDAGQALALLQGAGYRLVLVTNQPGVAFGLFDETALPPLWAAIGGVLAPHGVALDGIYYCPHHPEGRCADFARQCHCRKPAPGMLLRAARELGLDLARSWLIGDILDDVEAGHRAGCRCVLLDVGSETEWRDSPLRRPECISHSLTDAAADILIAPAARGARREGVPWTR